VFFFLFLLRSDHFMCYFMSKRVQIPTFSHIWKWAILFLWIDYNESFRQNTDTIPLSLKLFHFYHLYEP
jgi:hypothetical protein